MEPQRARELDPGTVWRVYPSKRDRWLVLLLWGGAILLAVAAAEIAGSPLHLMAKVGFMALTLGGVALCLWPLYSTFYTLTDTHLVARCGPFRALVPLEAIQAVTPSRNPLASPACSLDRFHVRYRGSRLGLLISPEDKSAFLQSLARVSPGLKVSGDRAVRE